MKGEGVSLCKAEFIKSGCHENTCFIIFTFLQSTSQMVRGSTSKIDGNHVRCVLCCV